MFLSNILPDHPHICDTILIYCTLHHPSFCEYLSVIHMVKDIFCQQTGYLSGNNPEYCDNVGFSVKVLGENDRRGFRGVGDQGENDLKIPVKNA